VDELLNRDLEDFTALNMTEVRNQCRAALITHKSRQLEITIQNSTGKLLWFECRILPTITNGQYHVLVQFIDLTERRRIEEDLRYHAFHDALTRLPNRRLLLDRLKQSVYSSKRQNSHGAVLLLDMNRFKQLNDTYGHDAGDLMLIEVADRLQRVVRVTDTVARLGGDEFVVLLEGLGPDKEIAKTHAVSITDKIHRALCAEYVLGNIHYLSSASIGITIFHGDDAYPDQVLKDADAAMYEAKKTCTA
jgi:diguanylate cyclase (GGDEF)-like protein